MIGRCLLRSVSASIVCLAIATTALAATNEQRRVLNAAGGIATNAGFRQVFCVGQQGGFTLTRGVGMHAYAGYLGGVALKPALDTDGDLDFDDIPGFAAALGAGAAVHVVPEPGTLSLALLTLAGLLCHRSDQLGRGRSCHARLLRSARGRAPRQQT